MIYDLLVFYLAVKVEAVKWLIIELGFVLLVATAFVMLTRGLQLNRVLTVIRALLAHRIWLSRSALLDYKYAALNMLVFPLILGLMMISAHQVGNFVVSYTAPVVQGEPYLSETQARFVLNITLFLALEFAYWLDHYLSHKVPLLWEFHKVHHSAEVLTPLTNYRVHPVDTLYFYNIKALIVGIVYGIVIYFMNTGPIPIPEGSIFMIYMWLYGHLQHSHVWIAFPGVWGKIFFSPAHHQIHHSKAKVHHNTNFGMSLAIFDWLFGTLHVPTLKKQQLEFGVSNNTNDHQLGTSLLEPLQRAWKRVKRPHTNAPAQMLAPSASRSASSDQATTGYAATGATESI